MMPKSTGYQIYCAGFFPKEAEVSFRNARSAKNVEHDPEMRPLTW